MAGNCKHINSQRALVLFLLAVLFSSQAARAADKVDYRRQVKPILERHCYACHGALKQQGSLRLDTAAAARQGGDSGPALVAGDLEKSLLWQAITGDAGFQMPPEGQGAPLNAKERKIVRAWIVAGAAAPADEKPQTDPRTYWSYQPPRRTTPPRPRDERWSKNPVDAFLQQAREARKLTPRPPARPAVLLRRLYLDLVGLPPTVKELRTFLADPSDAAYEAVVDDLLARPQYGERWGRHWMDVWRYSDWYGSRGGNEIRYSQRHIWRWRDWIVESLNADKPYSRMLLEMLAGDELEPANPDTLRATGYLGRNWYKFDRNVWMFDTVEHTSRALLGLTLRCCRCHDHKYDPISQEEYYRFRAFFEPHNVRVDAVPGSDETVKDSKLGAVLKDGLSRVYDKELDAPTYVFARGDGRRPEKDRPLTPGVPAALGGPPLKIRPVDLPPDAFYPALRPKLAEGMLKGAESKRAEQAKKIDAARAKRLRAEVALNQAQAKGLTTRDAPPPPFLTDAFDVRDKQRWKVRKGEWKFDKGVLRQTAVTTFATIVADQQTHPRDFRGKVRYRTLKAGTYRSVGLSFDYDGKGNSQDIYTSTGDASQSIQAFHRVGGKDVYPRAGIVRTKIKLGSITTVEFEARGQSLKIWLNGELKLDYVMPVKRRAGKFALWVHQGAAEFLDVELRSLDVTVRDLERRLLEATQEVARAQLHEKTLAAERNALAARLAAERAKFGSAAEKEKQRAALEASRAERRVAALQAEEKLLASQHTLARVKQAAAATGSDRQGTSPSPTPSRPLGKPPKASKKKEEAPKAGAAVAAAEKRLAAARKQHLAALAAIDKPDGKYKPLGKPFPHQSTGRRLALARWIVHRDNPRTARVAVNHIWLRHFGSALVPSVANFGLNGKTPSHPELLDYLAWQLMDNGWRMKKIHKLLVMSQTYRLTSRPGDDEANRRIDPENRFLWRMNARRMEAEVVRDSLLAVAGSLDLTRGGPEIPETQGQTVLRRSMYFRLTPNEKMKILELFDVADPNACYRRKVSVAPQQALALSNSKLALGQARKLERELSSDTTAKMRDDRGFISAAFERILSRPVTAEESAACEDFLKRHARLLQGKPLKAFSGAAITPAPHPDPTRRARENLVHVLLNHNDFVTIR